MNNSTLIEEQGHYTVKEIAKILRVNNKYVYDNLVNNPNSRFPVISLPCKERCIHRVPKREFREWQQTQLRKHM